MATLADTLVAPEPSGLAAVVDRWIYVFMAVLFLALVLAGFIPDSQQMLADVKAGARPPLPTVLHVHAVLMGSWLLLLLAQTVLMATNRPALHKQLGMAAFVLAPALVVVGFLLVPAMRIPLAEAAKTVPALRPTLDLVLNIMLLQIRIGLGFASLLAIGLLVRRSDSELHKRLMILATAAPMPAAIDRIAWLPSTMPASPLSVTIGLLAIISPMLLWDLYRLRRIHRAYLIWFLVYLPTTIMVHALWGTAWWRAATLNLLGVTGI